MIRKISLISIIVLIMLSAHLYYPKWQQSNTEATISWDVSGYYMYLPAIFIYKDVKQCRFYEEVRSKYNFTPDFQQAFTHENSGNYVMKYPLGQAVQFSPFFFIAHAYASISPQYEADGFSRPYQFMISFGSLLISLVGLLCIYRSLLVYFNSKVAYTSILLLVLGTNYLNYAAIDGAMTHNNLFTIYAILIFTTIKFYQAPSLGKGALIGSLVGLATLTRPTEIISCLIPILWGVDVFSKTEIKNRLQLIMSHRYTLVCAIVMCCLIGSLQLFYWHYVSGEWIVYSYQEQGFSWLKPHMIDGLMSYRSGWLMYTPLMIFSVIGFWSLYKNHRLLFGATFSFFILYIYIAFAWDVWWYGGSLGQRTMVQAYAILLFPLAAWIERLYQFNRIAKYISAAIIALFIYANLWFTHQAHKGGLLHPGSMTKAYFWKTIGTYKHNSENLKLLDTDEYFDKKRNEVTPIKNIFPDEILLNDSIQYSEIFLIENLDEQDWTRLSADISIKAKEWDVWRMAQMIVTYKNHDETVKQNFIRIQRHLNDHQSKRIFLDTQYPKVPVTHIEVVFWNGGTNKPVTISNIEFELFN